MKGYVIETGYMGYVDGNYMLFADEEDYREYFEECRQQALEHEVRDCEWRGLNCYEYR